jgi:hypothetical protein
MVRRHQSTIPNYPILGFDENFLFRGILLFIGKLNLINDINILAG